MGKQRSELFPYYGATGQVGWIDGYRSEGFAILLGEDGAPFLDRQRPKAYPVDGRYWVNNHAHILRPRDAKLDRFLCHQLNQVDYVPHVSGTTRLKLTKGAMLGIPLVIPSADEAEKIGVAIDALFADLDEAEAALGRAREGATEYRTSLLHAACTGNLTSAWRAANPRPAEDGPALLRGILAERRAAWERAELARTSIRGNPAPKHDVRKPRYQEPEVPDTDGLPGLPEGWAWASLDQLISEPPRNGVSVQGRAEPPGVPALRLDALGDDELHHARHRFIDIPEAKAASLFIAEGDFLVSRANGSLRLLGKACVAGRLPTPTVFPDTMIRFRFVRPSIGVWVSLAWRAGLVRRQFEARAKTSAGIWKVNQDDLLAVAIPMPPEREMEQAIMTVEDATLPDQELSGKAEIAALRQAVLHAAFTGRLVPQEPASEPAPDLLARLRAVSTAPGRTPRRIRPVQEVLL